MKLYNHITFYVIVMFFCFAQKSFSQNFRDISFELQAYPTGIIPGFSIDYKIGDRSWLYGRIAYNWIRHRDLGEHEDERGYGFGLSIGYKYNLSADDIGWRIGIKSDVWRNIIDWTEGSDSGSSDITVIQPTIELSYIILKNELIVIPSLAAGFEVNVRTVGEKTGQGAILLIGLQLGKRL